MKNKMRHIKTYKIFENNSQMSPEAICEEIEDILISLSDEELKVEVNPRYESKDTFIEIVIVEKEHPGFDFSVEEFADEFKQLFSFVEGEGWTPMGADEYIITETPGGQKLRLDASYVDTTDLDYICPECASDESSEIDSDNEECDKCGYLGHPDDFIVSKVKFGTLDKLLFLIQRRLDKIQICFIKK